MLVLTGLERQMTADFKEALAAQLPDLEIAIGSVEDRPERVEFMLSWAPREEEVARYPNLRFICSGGAGVDGILRVKNLPLDLPIVRLVDKILTQRMTHYIVHAVLHHFRQTEHYQEAQAKAKWDPATPYSVKGRRIGILGLGALGSDAAEKLLALEFQVAGWSRRPKSMPGVMCHHGPEGLRTLLANTEIIVCLLPLTGDTRGLIDAVFLEQLPRGAYLINPARGGLINDDALLAALDSGHLLGAALDVFNEEPLPSDHPYWSHPGVAVTPHMASRTHAGSAIPQLAENIRRARAGEPLNNQVDREAGY